MNSRFITTSEIAARQLQVRTEAHRARHSFTISGVRQLVGSTFIALGTRVVGQCEQKATAADISSASASA